MSKKAFDKIAAGLADAHEMSRTRILATINPHEQEAMAQLVLAARAIASTLGTDVQAIRLHAWANIVEEVLNRIEQKEPAQ